MPSTARKIARLYRAGQTLTVRIDAWHKFRDTTAPEMDRLRNLLFVRHIDNPEKEPRHQSFHLVFMTQTLERAGDHVKNTAEEVCHLVTGRSARHLIRANDKPFEEMFLDWMRRQKVKS